MTKNNNNSPGLTASSILVAYATRYGSTKEVAEEIAKTLRESGSGLEVDIQPARNIRSLEGHRAVVLGTPLYIGSMLKDARKFLENHKSALQSMPVAIFALGPISADENIEDNRKQLENQLSKVPWFKPVDTQVFVGKYDPAKLRFLDSLVARPPASPLHGVGPRDDRNWDTIRAWAKNLAAKLRSV